MPKFYYFVQIFFITTCKKRTQISENFLVCFKTGRNNLCYLHSNRIWLSLFRFVIMRKKRCSENVFQSLFNEICLFYTWHSKLTDGDHCFLDLKNLDRYFSNFQILPCRHRPSRKDLVDLHN